MAEDASASRLPRWRFGLGVACFIAAFAVHLVTPVAIAAGAGAATVGAIVAINFVLNKVLLLATVAVLGKAGFLRLKEILFGAVRTYVFTDEVGPLRYGTGLVLFVVPIVLAWVAPYVAEFVPSLGRHSIRDGVIADAVLIISLVLLGGGFWEKLRALFVREASVVFPGGSPRA